MDPLALKANESSKIKEEKKKKQKEKNRIALLFPETQARSVRYMAKAFKARCPKPSLVGSRRLSVRYTGGWVEFSEL